MTVDNYDRVREYYRQGAGEDRSVHVPIDADQFKDELEKKLPSGLQASAFNKAALAAENDLRYEDLANNLAAQYRKSPQVIKRAMDKLGQSEEKTARELELEQEIEQLRAGFMSSNSVM